ncbi:7-cyano-7-deazaguanine synthase QueC [Methanoregula boonei]|jgi:7-cyano-7-deazaguanine synthase|nr:7-cyano-7-deazaguanine synthase QueC [Methanoregula boonei]
METGTGMKAVLILSGGMDSTTLLYDLIDQGYEVSAITFDYHQKHKKEIACAQKTCAKLSIPHKIVNLSVLNDLAPSSLTRADRDVPEGHYAEESMKQTVVPNRNMVFLSLAASYAIGIGAGHLFYAAHAGDHAIYPDCRPVFVSAMSTAFHLCDWNDLVLQVPYLMLSKGDIAKKGIGLGVDYANTWSCYKGKERSCGKCGACTERLEAFREAGAADPLEYEP